MDCIFPAEIKAGLTFSKLVVLTAYSAPDWVLSVILRGPANIDLTATAEGSSHRLAADAETTAEWTPGSYWFSARVVHAENGVFEVDSGTVLIRPDLAGLDDPYDGRTHAQRVLASIEAVIEQRATRDQERYTINNRELWRTPIADLLALRNQYRIEVKNEQAKLNGKNLFNVAVKVRF